MIRLLAALLLAASAAEAGNWTTPERGSPQRRALMDALRPHAVEVFGAPVEFVVRDLRVAGDVAFASVTAQRPGGGRIDIERTPGWRAGWFLPDADWTDGQALYRGSGEVWVVVEHAFGATEAWWAAPEYCARWRAVIAEFCP